jgi:hypothetical protein
MDELRDKIANILLDKLEIGSDFICTELEVADQILALFEGWKSEEEVDALAMDSVIASLQGRIEWIGEELDRMQSKYRKMTGKDYVWLK